MKPLDIAILIICVPMTLINLIGLIAAINTLRFYPSNKITGDPHRILWPILGILFVLWRVYG